MFFVSCTSRIILYQKKSLKRVHKREEKNINTLQTIFRLPRPKQISITQLRIKNNESLNCLKL